MDEQDVWVTARDRGVALGRGLLEVTMADNAVACIIAGISLVVGNMSSLECPAVRAQMLAQVHAWIDQNMGEIEQGLAKGEPRQ